MLFLDVTKKFTFTIANKKKMDSYDSQLQAMKLLRGHMTLVMLFLVGKS